MRSESLSLHSAHERHEAKIGRLPPSASARARKEPRRGKERNGLSNPTRTPTRTPTRRATLYGKGWHSVSTWKQALKEAMINLLSSLTSRLLAVSPPRNSSQMNHSSAIDACLQEKERHTIIAANWVRFSIMTLMWHVGTLMAARRFATAFKFPHFFNCRR